jgi:formylglycine-generating enzyme required for sulfatase activity
MSFRARESLSNQARRGTCFSVVLSWLLATGVCDAQSMSRDSIPGTLVSFEMVAVPAGMTTVAGKDIHVAAFVIGRTELSWDAYDAYMLSTPNAAERSTAGADAVSRPSRPYGAPDYGWGHHGFPAISIARGGAEAFCAWLSTRTGKKYRLPTEAEWVHAATLANGGKPISATRIDALAWHAGNATGTTHASGTRQTDLLGLQDLFGNAAEWVVGDDGKNVVRGGSFRDTRKGVGPSARAEQDDSWQERDPQIPKSRWWLSDGPFIGFRIVREP